MMKAVLALFLFGAVNTSLTTDYIGGGLYNLGNGSPFGKPSPAQNNEPVQQSSPQPQVCQQSPQTVPISTPQIPNILPNPNPFPSTQIPNIPLSSNPFSPTYNFQPPIAFPGFQPQPPFAYPGFPSQPPQILPPSISVPGYPSNPNYPQQPLLPNVPQTPNNPNCPQQPSLPNVPQTPSNPPQPQRNDGYVLSFDWAPKAEHQGSSRGRVWIGNQIIADLSPAGGSKVRNIEINIDLQNGDNGISFEGTGDSDQHGATVTNVGIRRRDSNQNLLVNGDFSSPYLSPGTWQYFPKGIKGWTVGMAEVGECRLYNKEWKSGLQCIELDSTENQIYTQRFKVNKS